MRRPGEDVVRIGLIVRALAILTAVVLTTGSVVAADPSIDPSGSPAASGVATSPEPSEAPTVQPSEAPSTTAPSESEEPAESESPSQVAAPSKAAAEPSEAPDASEAPERAETPGAPPSDAEIADFVGRLKAAGITTTAAEFKALAAKVGVGGAVRTLAFAHASGKTPAAILAMFEGGKGWGRIDHELGLSIGPGIGWIMRNGHKH
jgi:hypothetical protein